MKIAGLAGRLSAKPHLADSARRRRVDQQANVEGVAEQGDSKKDDVKSPLHSLSIAVQVYIDKDMTADQVDHVFASMARHLYGKQ